MSEVRKTTKRGPLRFVVFLLLLAVLLTYIALKWNRFNEETIAQQEEPIASLGKSGQTDSVLGVEYSSAQSSDSRETFNYFIEARLQREKARSAQQVILREIIDNPNSSDELRTAAQQELLELAKTIGRESELEELIRAKGFEEVLIYLHDQAAVVVVRTEALTGEEVARIADIVNRFGEVPLQALSIIPRPK